MCDFQMFSSPNFKQNRTKKVILQKVQYGMHIMLSMPGESISFFESHGLQSSWTSFATLLLPCLAKMLVTPPCGDLGCATRTCSFGIVTWLVFGKQLTWLVDSTMFYFHPYLGKRSNFTYIFQMGWNQQPEMHSSSSYMIQTWFRHFVCGDIRKLESSKKRAQVFLFLKKNQRIV